MPVFEPNEYFWEHHWDGVEEKWIAYARALQTIMAEKGGFELSDSRMEDMLEYRKLILSRKSVIKGHVGEDKK